MPQHKKQLVAFLDLLGFRHYYDIILNQKKPDSKEHASRVIGHLYQSYMSRLRESISKSYKIMSKSADKNGLGLSKEIQDSILNPKIISISDSIILAIDCDESTIVFAYMLLVNALLLLFDETMKPDYMPGELKKYNMSIFCPIRGGISYDYAALDFETKDPMLYGIAFYKAYKLEAKAGWPRVVLDDELSQILAQNKTCLESLSKTGDPDCPLYFDVLKMKFESIIKKFSKIEDKRTLASDFLRKHHMYLILNARQASMLCKYEYTSYKKIFPKYEAWAVNYNYHIQQIIEKEKGLAKILNPLIIDMNDLLRIFDNYEYEAQ